MLGLDLRDGVDGLVDYAKRDLSVLWRQVDDAAQANVALNDILPALIRTYGDAAGALAADWYDEQRAKAEVGGRFRAFPAEIKDVGAPELVGWASATANDYGSFQALIEGGMQRRIANFSRGTITGSSVADPKARGWQRVGSGGCKTGFCDMLIGRGAVYTEATADFAAHDNCRCSAVPAFGGEARPVKPYTPTLRNVSDTDVARTKAWIATH